MKHSPTYEAAKNVSETVAAHFAHHHAKAVQRGEVSVAPVPDKSVIEALIDIAFWCSLRKEEGVSPRISLAYFSPDHPHKNLLLQQPLALTPSNLTKLAPGLERPGIHAGVWLQNGELQIWGTTLDVPDLCFVVDVSEPALLVVKHRSLNGYGKFNNVAVLQGDKVKIVDEASADAADAPHILKWLLGTRTGWSRSDAVNVYIQLALSMRRHGHGGILLIVPRGSEEWQESVIQPMAYAITPVVQGLAQLVRSNGGDVGHNPWLSALRREVEHLAGLTAIDGATVMNDYHELLAFGVKIGRKAGGKRVEKIAVIEPVVGGEARTVHPALSGGTRHLSAAQFVHDQRGAMALVASQDGRFTVFTWSQERNMVVAHRIESLLL